MKNIIVVFVVLILFCLNIDGNEIQNMEETYNKISKANELIYKAKLGESKYYAEGEEILLKIVEEDPKNFLSLMFLGDMYFWTGDYKKSKEYTERAIKVDPSRKELLSLNIMLIEKNSSEELEKRKELMKQKGLIIKYDLKALEDETIKKIFKDNRENIKIKQDASEKSNDVDSLLARAFRSKLEEDIGKALNKCNSMLEDSSVSYYGKISLYQKILDIHLYLRNNIKDAEKTWSSLNKITEGKDVTIKTEIENIENASRRMFEKYNNSLKYEKEEYILKKISYYEKTEIKSNNKISEIVEELLKEYENNPKDINICIRLGKEYQQKGLFEDALKYYNKATAIDEKLIDIHKRISVLNGILKRYDVAIKELEKAKAIDPTDEVIDKKIRALKYLLGRQSEKKEKDKND